MSRNPPDPPLPKWFPSLQAYPEKIALKFTKKDFRKALNIVMEKERGMPYDLAGFRVIILPKVAIPYFKGLDFKKIKVVHASEIPPKELTKLRKENLG